MAGPFPANTIEAVGACTRAIAGPGASENLEARLALSDAATVSGLRAYGDRLAIRQRFHDARIYEAHQPVEKPPPICSQHSRMRGSTRSACDG